MGAAAAAIGLFASSLTENQIISAVVSFSILLLFWIIDWAADAISFRGREILEWFSILSHLEDFRQGIIGLDHLFYYFTLTIFFIFLTIQNIERRRWN